MKETKKVVGVKPVPEEVTGSKVSSDTASWAKQVLEEIDKWKKDETYIPILMRPVTREQVITSLLEEAKAELVTHVLATDSLDIPEEPTELGSARDDWEAMVAQEDKLVEATRTVCAIIRWLEGRK